MDIQDDGKGNFKIGCETCGKPITKTSSFGMDCEDDCAKREFENDPLADKVLGMIRGLGGHLDRVDQGD